MAEILAYFEDKTKLEKHFMPLSLIFLPTYSTEVLTGQ